MTAGTGAGSGMVVVGASNDFSADTFTGAGATGLVGLSSRGHGRHLRSSVDARIEGATVTADEDVRLRALTLRNVEGIVASGSVGLAALTASISSWTLGGTISTTYGYQGAGPLGDQSGQCRGDAGRGQVGRCDERQELCHRPGQGS